VDHSIETDRTAEWLYHAIVTKTEEPILDSVEAAFNSVFSGEPVITEAMIDEALEDDADLARESYELGDLTKEEYDQWISESGDRAEIKEDLSDASEHILLEDGYAACELLAALLGKPGEAFEHAKQAYSKFERRFLEVKEHCDNGRLRALSSTSEKVIVKLSEDKSIAISGYSGEDKKLWLSNLKDLSERLA